MSAAEMGEELSQLKQHLDQGLLTYEQYKACVDKAVAKYSNAGAAAPAAPAAPSAGVYKAAAPRPGPAAPMRQAGAGAAAWGGEAAGGYYAGAPAAAAWSPYPAPAAAKGGGKYSGKGVKGGKKGAAEPEGPVVKQQGKQTFGSFDPNMDRSACYAGVAGTELRDYLVEALTTRGGAETLLAHVTSPLVSDIASRRKYEDVLGDLSPQAFEAFAAFVGGVRIVKEQREDTYQPQWYIALVE